jgi:hypothetical protein
MLKWILVVGVAVLLVAVWWAGAIPGIPGLGPGELVFEIPSKDGGSTVIPEGSWAKQTLLVTQDAVITQWAWFLEFFSGSAQVTFTANPNCAGQGADSQSVTVTASKTGWVKFPVNFQVCAGTQMWVKITNNGPSSFLVGDWNGDPINADPLTWNSSMIGIVWKASDGNIYSSTLPAAQRAWS